MNNYDLISFVRERKEVEPAKISLQKFLESVNMENYLKVCSNRITDAQLIDGEEVEIDFINFPNLSLTQIGIMTCLDILSGYIDEDEIKKILEALKNENETRELMNQQIRLLRAIKKADLINFIKKPEQFIGEKEIKNLVDIQTLCREELKSRNLINRVKIFFKDHIMRLYVSIRYARLISLMKSVTLNYINKNDNCNKK